MAIVGSVNNTKRAKYVQRAKKTALTNKTTPVKYSFVQDQLQHFILLANILNTADLELDEVKACLRKYLDSLDPQQLRALTVNLPNAVEGIDQMDFPYVKAIAKLSGGKMTLYDVAVVATRAKLRFVEFAGLGNDPEKGWLTCLLHALARDASSQHPGAQDTAWFAAPRCAVWLAIMARFRIILSRDEWRLQVSNSLDRAYHDGWLGVFGLQRGPAPAGTTTTPAPGGMFKADTSIQGPSSMASMGAYPFLTQHFFTRQMLNPRYLSLVAEIPNVVEMRSQQLRRELGLQPRGEKDQRGGAKGRTWGKWRNRGDQRPRRPAPLREVRTRGAGRMQNWKSEVVELDY